MGTTCLFGRTRLHYHGSNRSQNGFTLTPPPPPPKPPDRSFAQIPVKFQVIRNFTIHQSPPEPLDPNHIAVNTTILPSYVETAVCPPSVWKNVCVNGIEISTRLSNVSVYLNFKEVFVEGMSNDMFVLGCHMFMLYPNRPITQPTPSFMSSWSIPSAQHHRKNEYEQVILVVSLGIGSYGHIALEYGYTMNAFKNTEAYGYGVVLSNVFIIKPPDISHKAVNLNATCHSWRFVVCGEVVILSRLYALNTQGGLCDDHDLTSAYSFYKVKSAPICRYLNGFEPLFLHKQNGGPVITITISMYGLISYVSHNWLSLYQLHTLSFDNIFPCPKFCAPHSKEFFMMFQKKKLNREVHLQEYEALDCYGSIVIFPSNKAITVGGLVVVDFDVNGLVILVETLTNAKRICCENHWPNSGSCLKLQVQKLCLFHDVRFHPNAKYMSIIQSMKLKLLIERVINVMASRREIRGIVLPFQTIFPTLDVFIKYCFFSGIIGQPLVQIDQLKDFYIIEGAESVERAYSHLALKRYASEGIHINYLGLDYIVANPPPPPEPPDEVVIQTSLLVQHLHEQACLSLLLLLTVTRNLTAAPPPPEPPDLSNMATHFSMELLSYACVSKCYVVVVMQFMCIMAAQCYRLSHAHWIEHEEKQNVLVSRSIVKGNQWEPGEQLEPHMTVQSSPFKQWDPGGCSLICGQGLCDFSGYLKVTTTTTIQHYYFGFNLEDKVDFKGDGNVMSLRVRRGIMGNRNMDPYINMRKAKEISMKYV
ncbi:sucrose synthase [Medicago truncatula]|uniref:Sucrose synthase n=1 Tax=Medicago truncatula TaxID=3880 RepID=A0A072TFG9_MEDTR|nr:sucrose synthase [Medicago truncatula]